MSGYGSLAGMKTSLENNAKLRKKRTTNRDRGSYKNVNNKFDHRKLSDEEKVALRAKLKKQRRVQFFKGILATLIACAIIAIFIYLIMN